jgi:hypothetical protein
MDSLTTDSCDRIAAIGSQLHQVQVGPALSKGAAPKKIEPLLMTMAGRASSIRAFQDVA